MNRRNLVKSSLVLTFVSSGSAQSVDTKEKDFQKIHNLFRPKWAVREYADWHVDDPNNPTKILGEKSTPEQDVNLQEYTTFDDFMKTLESLEGEKSLFIFGKILLYRNCGKYYYGTYSVHYKAVNSNYILGDLKPYIFPDWSYC